MQLKYLPLAVATLLGASSFSVTAGEGCITGASATNQPAPVVPPVAPGAQSLACGNGSRATGTSSTAYGVTSDASGGNSVAVGTRSRAVEFATTAVGSSAEATAFGASAFGASALASGRDSTAVGFGVASGEGSNAMGTVFGGVRTQASGLFTNAYGSGAVASGDYSDAYGAGAQSTGTNSVALGSNSVADRAGTVSVGSATQQRQITNVAAGTQATDAVNLQQLRDTLDTARAYTDTAVATGGTAANAYTDNREVAIRNDMDATESELRGEIQSGDAQTLQSARQYVDTRFSALIGSDLAAFDRRIDSLEARMGSQDIRISRLGALSAAMGQMTANAMGAQSAQGRLSIGAGWYGGESALSVGYGRKLGSRMSVTLGGAFSASERSAGVGFGVDL